MATYKYKAMGRGANDASFTVEGEVTSSWEHVFDAINRACFMKLTRGEAVYGNPGVGCRGPYVIDHFEIDLRERQE